MNSPAVVRIISKSGICNLKFLAGVAFGLLACSQFAHAEARKGLGSSFTLETLPIGADVTLPGPATTIISISSRVTLSATDSPQTLSFTSVNHGQGVPTPLRLAIFDRNQARVKYVELRPGTPFLYSFKSLSTISVVPEIGKGAAVQKGAIVKLQVESDKPLTIAR